MNLDRRLLAWALRAKGHLAVTVALGLLAGGLVVGQAWLLSRAVSQVFLAGAGLRHVQPLLLAFLGLSLARAALVWGSEVTAGQVALQAKRDLRQQLAAHLLALGPAYTQGERSGELINTAVEGVEALDAYLRLYLPQVALSALVPLTILAFVFPLDWPSGLVLLLTAPLIPVFMILIGSAADALTRRQWSALSRMSAHFLDVLQGLPTLKHLGRARNQLRAIAEISERYRQTTVGVLRVAFLSALVLELVGTISTAVVAVQIGLRLLYGLLTFEQAFFVLILAPEFYQPLRSLGARFHAGIAGVTAARRIVQVLDEAPSQDCSPATAQPGDGPGRAGGEQQSQPAFPISFADVYHAYDDGRRPALNGFSLTLEQGERVALVGPTGAGKSTVASLLLRFQEPDGGTITVGGRRLDELSATQWRRCLSWLPQNPYLFHGTVGENIALARPDASREAVGEAARLAHADGFIESLPLGYDTIIGERGARLSGGEAQRIALARVFFENAPLVILDEATAYLDPEIEDQVQASIARLLVGRTALVIAHRLATVEEADRILVLDAGRVVQAGSHAALMEQDGLYRSLAEAPAQKPPLATTGQPAVPEPEGSDIAPVSASERRLRAPALPALPALSGAEGSEAEGSKVEAKQSPAPQPELSSSQASPLTTPGQLSCQPEWPYMPRGALAQEGRGTFRRLLGLAAPLAGWMVLAALLGWATIASSIGLMATAAYVIAKAALQPSIAEIQVAIVGVRFFGISRGIFRYLERMVSHQVTFRLLARLRVWFYRAVEPLAPAGLLRYRSGDLLARIVADVGTLENLYLRVLAPPLIALLVAASATLFLASFGGWMAGGLLAALLLAGVGVPSLVRLASRGPGRRLVQLRSELTATLVDLIQGLPDLLAFGQEGRQLDRLLLLGRETAAQQSAMDRIGGLHSALAGLLMNLATLTVLALAIPLVVSGQLDGVYLALLCLAAIASFEAVLPLPQAFQNLESSLEAGRRLFEIVDTEPAVQKPAHPLPVPPAPDLRIDNLRFSYGADSGPALDGIGFDLPRGGKLAVVGPSGAGKTTLLHLLLRFWEYDRGRILAAGRELAEFDPEAWREQIAHVSQRTHLFNATVRQNLLLARPDATEEQMVRAAHQARIHQVIEAFPYGYDTWIGEQGVRLSGGERQRLAVARAILKDAPILLLDEPTANLDPVTEREVLQSLQDLGAGRTVLLATHRLVGLEDFDEILVLRSGRVVQRGTHHELMARGGIYRRMADLQTRRLAPVPVERPLANFVP